MAYNSKYTGEQVEELLDKVDGLTEPTKVSQLENDAGYITSSDVPTKTSELENDVGYITEEAIEGKQDKLEYYTESSTLATIDAPAILFEGNQLNIGVPSGDPCEVYIYSNDGSVDIDSGKGEVDIRSAQAIYINGNNFARLSSDNGNVELLPSNKATYNGVEIATVDDIADIITLHELQGKYTLVDLCEMMSYWFLKVPNSFYIRDIKIVGYDGETKKCKIQFDFISKYGESTNVYIGSYQTGTLYGNFPCVSSSDYVHYAESYNYYFSIPYDVDVVDGEFVEMNSGEKLYIHGRD